MDPPGHSTADAAPQQRALIIAIGDYPAGSRYSDLNSINDVPLIRGALRHQGFDDSRIHVLSDSAATRTGILEAIRTRLLAPAQEGDVLFLHYSGHGVQVTDDDGDELDGYDEALVPYDARALRLERGPTDSTRTPDAGIAMDAMLAEVAASYVRDDEIGSLVAELRRRVGPAGNVVVSIDACNSGSATRGLPVRGSPDPIGPPATSARSDGSDQRDVGSGFADGGAGTTRGQTGGLAPYVVLAASRHDEPAREVRAEDGTSVGSLSLALSRALAEAGPGTSYRSLFDRVKARMAVLVPLQTPQLEGDMDTELFSGRALPQRPYFDVRSVRGDSTVVLAAGTLLGVHPGTEVALYPPGTSSPGAAALATGRVLSATATRAVVRLAGPGLEDALQAWAFVTRYAPGELTVGVDIDPELPAPLAEDVGARLDSMAVARVTREKPDLVVIAAGSAGDAVELRSADDDRLLYGPVDDATPELAGRLARRVQGYARNRYLARIGLEAPGLDVRFEVVPARHRFDFDGACVESTPIDRQGSTTGGSDPLRFRPGDGYLLRLHNRGTRPAYVTVLSLAPDGSIVQLFPVPQLSGQDNYLEPDRSFLVDLCYTVEEPYGVEILKLFATRERVDFWPILHGTEPGRAGQSLNPLERLLSEVQSGTRSRIAGPPRAAGSTHAVTIHVER